MGQCRTSSDDEKHNKSTFERIRRPRDKIPRVASSEVLNRVNYCEERSSRRSRRRSVYFSYCWSLPNNLPLSPPGLSAATYLSVIANFSKLSFIAGLLLCRFHSKHFIELHSEGTKEPTALPQFILRFYSPCESAGATPGFSGFLFWLSVPPARL